MKKLLCALLALAMLCGMVVPALAADNVVYISYNKGDNSNPGTSASAPKKSLGTAGAGGARDALENGGILVISEKFFVGGDYTFSTRGEVTIKGSYGGTDYKNPEPATNPASGAMKFASGKILTVASDLVLDDIILFQEAGQNTFIVKSGATLTVTENIVCTTKTGDYMKIVVEAGGTANVNGGIFASVTGKGSINIGPKAKVTGGSSTPAPADKPAPAANGVCFLSYSGSNTNSGTSPSSPVKGYAGGMLDVLPNGGTVVVVGKSYIAGKEGDNSFTLPATDKPYTFTSVYDGKDYKNAEPATNPACAFKFGSGTVLNIQGDVVFDNIILFQENDQNTLNVVSGATLTVTDTVQLLTKPGNTYHYKVVIEKGATAFISEAAQKVFEIENKGGELVTYKAAGTTEPEKPATTGTEVKLTVGSKTAYVNGKAETLSAPAINRGGRVLLPVRFLANAFGVSNDGIAWDGATRTATLKNDKVTIVVTIDAPSMTVNGETVKLDSPAIISDNSTYLPVRAIANALGVSNDNIKWDAATNTATLVK